MSQELDEFLSRAVDRQIAEQRALREALNDLRSAVEMLMKREPMRDEPPPPDLATRDEIAALRRDIAELHATVSKRPPPPPPPPPVVIPEPADVDLAPLQEDLATVNANIDGIAQALIDLNAGLRDWASGVDQGLTSLSRAVTGVKAVADEARRAATAAHESLSLEVEERSDDDLDDLVDDRMEQVEARIEETGRLAMNIRDKLDEFEQLASGMRQLPKAIEGTVAQALKRAMAARAKLDHEAETAMDETLGAVDEQLDALNEAIGQINTSDDHVRKVALGQIELTSRIEAMQDMLMTRLDALERGRSAPKPAPKPQPQRRVAAPKPTTARKPTPRTKRRPPDDGEQ